MAANIQDLINNQTELSFTPPQVFYMLIERMPTLAFTLQRLQIPVINGEELILSNPMNPNRTPIPGSGLDYSVLSCDFIIDKNLKNYYEVLGWMKGMYAPEEKETQAYEWENTTSNITVIGTDAANTPLVRWQFIDAFPISMDGTMYDATMPDIEYLVSNVTFRFKYFTFGTYTDGTDNHDTI